jgi:hypothetical protein
MWVTEIMELLHIGPPADTLVAGDRTNDQRRPSIYLNVPSLRRANQKLGIRRSHADAAGATASTWCRKTKLTGTMQPHQQIAAGLDGVLPIATTPAK